MDWSEHTACKADNDVTCSVKKVELVHVSSGTILVLHVWHTLETTKVLTSITTLLATTEERAMMLRARITLSIMYPGPAKCSAERSAIVKEM